MKCAQPFSEKNLAPYDSDAMIDAQINLYHQQLRAIIERFVTV